MLARAWRAVLPLLGGVLLTGFCAIAAQAEAVHDCRGIGGVSKDDTVGTMGIRADNKRVHFIREGSQRAGCPNASAACQAPSYVIGGDHVIIGREAGDFICAFVIGKGGIKVQGFLPKAVLETIPQAHFHDWYGFWVIWGDVPRITIQHVDDVLVEISAELYGVVITGKVKPDGDRLDFAVGPGGKPIPIGEAADKACRLHLRNSGPYLLVDDENSCGTAKFSGIYSRS